MIIGQKVDLGQNILIGQANMMGIGCWIESIYGMEYGFRIVKHFRICTVKT